VTPRVGLLRVCVRVCVCVCVSVLHTSDSVSFRQRRFDPDCWCGMPWLCGCKAAWRLPHVESSVLLLAMYVRRTSPACMDTHTNVHQKHTHTRTHAHTHTHTHVCMFPPTPRRRLGVDACVGVLHAVPALQMDQARCVFDRLSRFVAIWRQRRRSHPQRHTPPWTPSAPRITPSAGSRTRTPPPFRSRSPRARARSRTRSCSRSRSRSPLPRRRGPIVTATAGGVPSPTARVARVAHHARTAGAPPSCSMAPSLAWKPLPAVHIPTPRERPPPITSPSSTDAPVAAAAPWRHPVLPRGPRTPPQSVVDPGTFSTPQHGGDCGGGASTAAASTTAAPASTAAAAAAAAAAASVAGAGGVAVPAVAYVPPQSPPATGLHAAPLPTPPMHTRRPPPRPLPLSPPRRMRHGFGSGPQRSRSDAGGGEVAAARNEPLLRSAGGVGVELAAAATDPGGVDGVCAVDGGGGGSDDGCPSVDALAPRHLGDGAVPLSGPLSDGSALAPSGARQGPADVAPAVAPAEAPPGAQACWPPQPALVPTDERTRGAHGHDDPAVLDVRHSGHAPTPCSTATPTPQEPPTPSTVQPVPRVRADAPPPTTPPPRPSPESPVPPRAPVSSQRPSPRARLPELVQKLEAQVLVWQQRKRQNTLRGKTLKALRSEVAMYVCRTRAEGGSLCVCCVLCVLVALLPSPQVGCVHSAADLRGRQASPMPAKRSGSCLPPNVAPCSSSGTRSSHSTRRIEKRCPTSNRSPLHCWPLVSGRNMQQGCDERARRVVCRRRTQIREAAAAVGRVVFLQSTNILPHFARTAQL